jgi:hypothetical protein
MLQVIRRGVVSLALAAFAAGSVAGVAFVLFLAPVVLGSQEILALRIACSASTAISLACAVVAGMSLGKSYRWHIAGLVAVVVVTSVWLGAWLYAL